MKSRRRVIQALIASAIAIIIITVMPLEVHSQYTYQSSLIQKEKGSINGTGIGGTGSTISMIDMVKLINILVAMSSK
jgi:hypothetical protein